MTELMANDRWFSKRKPNKTQIMTDDVENFT